MRRRGLGFLGWMLVASCGGLAGWGVDCPFSAWAHAGQHSVWVLAKAVPKGAILGPQDVTRKSIPRGALPLGAIGDPAEVLGMRTVRAMAAGTVLRKDQFRPQPVLRRGHRVQIVLERGGLRIVAPGEALEEGGAGESIKVLNTSSRRVILARVEAPNSVRVEF